MDITTEEMIEDIVDAIAGPTHSEKQAHYLRESLRHLVRLAKSEQAQDARRCVALAIGLPTVHEARQHRPSARKFLATFLSRQVRLNFETEVPE
jgi:hypothetical protein